jgi:ribonucleoside-diphosphate reductase alpha chain
MSKTSAGSQLDSTFWNSAHKAILNLEVMPSMRALMTAGAALERENLASFNCSFIAIDDTRAFDEALYILMNGVGLGFSVESEYISQLPNIPHNLSKTSSLIKIEDSKAGWAKGFRTLIDNLYSGRIPGIDVSGVRPAGARLKTFGGRASGPQPLVDLFDFTIGIFKAASGRKLTPIEAHDIMCKVGDVVVVGGVRRSALISLSDLGDYDMARAKSGSWYESYGHRRLANNSAVYPKKPSVGQFIQEWGTLIESHSGERGIFNKQSALSASNDRRDWSKVAGTNPCGEILLRSRGLCNLTEVIVKENDTLGSLADKVKIATILGTVQSSLTNFKYLRKSWKDNAEEERLLGVSMTGQFGHEVLNGSKGIEELVKMLDILKEVAIEVNKVYSEKIGINQSVAITTVKPSGTVSQLTNSSSGMHPWHSKFYIRTVRADNNDPMTEFLKSIGVSNEPDVMAPESTTIFSFPIAAPVSAVTRNDITAIQHLEIWKAYKQHWTEHNPSITINVKDSEWIEVANWVYENWDVVGGLSFLPYDGGQYKQAPYQECSEHEYNEFKSNDKTIDWSFLQYYEFEDNTTGSQTLACTAGNCDVVSIGS